ncbi:MAG: Ig-like domain-containing protein, partial [Spirochaetota bacterium]|nr:Ig-like domain-containing protein [Spirochaetota bacterium]
MKAFFKIFSLLTLCLMLSLAIGCTDAGTGGGDNGGDNGGNVQLPDYPDDPGYPDPGYPEDPNPNDPNPNDPNPDDPNPDDPNPDDPDNPEPTPGTEYDVTNLVVAEKTIDSVTISFQAPQEVNGLYFTVNGVKSDWVDFYDENLEYDYRTDTYSYTFTDEDWRSENGTSVTIKVTTDYITVDSDGTEIQKESEGVSVTVTTEPFDGTLPAYTGNYSRYNLNSIKVGGTFDEKGYLSEDFDLATWEFKSSDKTIATVDENGIVTGVKSGSAKIMFKNTDGFWYYREYTITDVLAEGMAINTIFSKVGGTLDADDIVFTSAEKDFAVSDKNVTWSAEDSTMVTIDGGKLTFAKAGSVNITATYNSDNRITATAQINVLPETVILKEDLTPNEKGEYISESGLGFTNNDIIQVVDGRTLDFNSYLRSNNYSLIFNEDFISKYKEGITVENIPVIEDENKISVYYVIKNVTADTKWTKLSFYFQHDSSFEEVGDGVRKWQLEKYSKEWVYFNVESGGGEYYEYASRWNFEEFDLG